MQRTASVFARIEPEIKEQAEEILSALGIPMSNAIGLFLRQVIMKKGIPFEITIPTHIPIATGGLSSSELSQELEKGYADILEGRTYDLNDVINEMKKKYGI